MKADAFIVVYDDGSGFCVPYGWDTDCDGAISQCPGLVALFDSRAAARKAINISRAYAKLCQSQGKQVNTDFTESLKCVAIFGCKRKDGSMNRNPAHAETLAMLERMRAEVERLRGIEEVDRRMCEVQLDMRNEINELRHDVEAKDEEIVKLRAENARLKESFWPHTCS